MNTIASLFKSFPAHPVNDTTCDWFMKTGVPHECWVDGGLGGYDKDCVYSFDEKRPDLQPPLSRCLDLCNYDSNFSNDEDIENYEFL